MLKSDSREGSLHYLQLVEVAGMIDRREVSPVELTRDMLERIGQFNSKLNAYLSVRSEAAMEEAAAAGAEILAGRKRSPLHGVPIGIKDLFHLQGLPTSFASRAFKAVVAQEDATIIRRLKEAGAIILGQLHLHEGAFAAHLPEIGNCISPWNPEYWPGGSSSGSGAALAAGLCYGALGTDTGGSIRFPSAASGVTGLKVTWGRTSRHGVLPLSESLDTIGPMARSAADCAAMLGIFAGADPRDPTSLDAPVPDYLGKLSEVSGAKGMRIGIDESHIGQGVNGEVAAAIGEAVDVLRRIGATSVPVKVPDRKEAIRAALMITDAECAQFHSQFGPQHDAEYGEALAGAIERGLSYSATELARAYIVKMRFAGEMARFMKDLDAFVAPIYPQIALRYATFDEDLDDLDAFVGYTIPYNLTGNPAIAFPVAFSSVNMPIGMQLVGGHLGEVRLLQLAHAFQQVTSWHRVRPSSFP